MSLDGLACLPLFLLPPLSFPLSSSSFPPLFLLSSSPPPLLFLLSYSLSTRFLLSFRSLPPLFLLSCSSLPPFFLFSPSSLPFFLLSRSPLTLVLSPSCFCGRTCQACLMVLRSYALLLLVYPENNVVHLKPLTSLFSGAGDGAGADSVSLSLSLPLPTPEAPLRDRGPTRTVCGRRLKRIANVVNNVCHHARFVFRIERSSDCAPISFYFPLNSSLWLLAQAPDGTTL